MKQPTTYQYFLKGIIFLLLIGQCLISTVPLYQWMLNSELDLIECYSSEDSELEKLESKNDISSTNDNFGYNTSFLKGWLLFTNDFQPLHHPTIITPPPEV